MVARAEAEVEEGVREGGRGVEGAGDGDGERLRGEWPGERSIAAPVAAAAARGLGLGIWEVRQLGIGEGKETGCVLLGSLGNLVSCEYVDRHG